MPRFGRIEAVIKITERCNINCTYCYIFNKESRLFEEKPKQMTLDTVVAVARFLGQSARDTGAGTVRVIFHGGEPMMVRPEVFDEMCRIFLETIQQHAAVQFTIQTNATLINERWIAILEKYHMGVGVSIDGPPEVNDLSRVDHKGRGTYHRTARGTRALFDAARKGRIREPGVLCVIDPLQDGYSTFLHLARDMGFKTIDFLLPIETRDTFPAAQSAMVGRFLAGAFAGWNELGDKQVTVRIFDKFYSFMTGYERKLNQPLVPSADTLIITVASDGTFGPDDALRIVSNDLFRFDCRTVSITEYTEDPAVAEVFRANAKPPDECRDCAWAAYCVGGSANGRVVNRYSRAEGFQRKSILCEGLSETYTMLARALINVGYPRAAMAERLDRAADQVLAR